MDGTNTITRTIEEITVSARMNMQDMTNRAIALGHDLSEAKQVLGHGHFLPWLDSIGISSSTAANFMKVAREVAPGSRLAGMQYSRVLALLAAPAEDREALAEETEGKSAAEIRRLIAERDKAAESCNAETVRADRAEADAKRFYDENSQLNNKISVLQNEVNKQKQYADDLSRNRDKQEREIRELQEIIDGKEEEYQRLLRQCDEEAREEEREAIQGEIDSLREQLEKTKADLIIAENNRIEVEVVPQSIQEERDALMAAAEDAEARAAAAEEELEKLRAERVESNVSEYEKLSYQIRVFMINCQIMVAHVNDLLPDRDKAIKDIDRLRNWCEVMRDELCKAVVIPEGADVQ